MSAFPPGKTKTVLIDLGPVLQERTVDRVRLRTNLEIYWDQIGWVTPEDPKAMVIQNVPLASVDLQYRGFSRVTAANASSPELPDYQELAGTMPRWRDLVGYYTRFGDVSELLDVVDDRYVIMNAGDEMRFLFDALPPRQNRIPARLCIGGRWLGERRRLQHNVFENGDPLALTRPTDLYYPSYNPLERSGLQKTPGRLDAIPHALRFS